MRLCLALALTLTACMPVRQPLYSVRRSALVPHPVPPARTGFPLAQQVSLSIHDSTVLVPIEPVETEGANAGLYVARHNVGGAVRVRAGDFDIGLLLEAVPLRGAMAVAEDAIAAPHGSPVGAGVALAYSAALTPRFRLGVDLTGIAIDLPYREEGRCTRNCKGFASYYMEDRSHLTAIGSASLLPSYRVGDVTLFGVVTRRNHPTNTKTESQTLWQNSVDDDDEMSAGPFYTLIGFGAEYQARPGVRVLAQVFQPLSTAVVTYGPAIGFDLSVDLGGGQP